MQALEVMEQLIKGWRSRPQLAGSVGLAEKVVLCYSQENKQLLLNKEVRPSVPCRVPSDLYAVTSIKILLLL